MAESSSQSAARAESESGTPLGNPYLVALMAWVVPGAGHFYLGRRFRALLFFLIILTSLVIGFLLDGKLHRQFGEPLASLGTLGAMGSGLGYAVLRFVLDYRGDMAAVGFEYGTTFLLTAGLLNLLLVMDAWDIARGTKE